MEIVKEKQPITGEKIGEQLGLTRSALRTDFSILIKEKKLESKMKKGYYYIEKEKKQYSRIKEIMSPPIVVDYKESVHDTIVDMFTEDVGNIFVIQNDSLAGVVSRKDLLKAAIGQQDITKIPVGMIMTRMPNVVYVEEDESILSGVKKLIKHQIDSMPVIRKVEEKGKIINRVIGRITKTNTTKLLMEMLEN